MHRQIFRQSVKIVFFILIIQFFSVSGYAAEDSWLWLKSPRFSVLSQLSEKQTRMWAEEFDRFVTALQQIHNTSNENLKPLTIVLFKKVKHFKPYRTRTESGQAKDVIAIFANLDSWSVIGLPGIRGYEKTRRDIYHEAVHWFISSKKLDYPLWLEEGLAEVYSTFEVRNGLGKWGLAMQHHIDYLNFKRLQPTREFLYADQDEALHELDTYYSQAWAMVHYLMFGDNGENREKFAVFLTELKTKSTRKAFNSAFGMTYSEFDKKLLGYIRGGKYMIGQIKLADLNTEMKVGTASDELVRFALGRLAIAGHNFDLAVQHAEAVIAGSPSSPGGYEILALAAAGTENKSRKLEALKKAISLNSGDPNIYFMQASMLEQENWRDSYPLDEVYKSDTAREIANMYQKSILLRTGNKYAMEGYAVALLNSKTYKEEDRKLLELIRSAFPKEGTALVGLAALARMDGDIDLFNRKLAESRGDSVKLSANLKRNLVGMQQKIYHEWLYNRLEPLVFEGNFEKADALIEEQGLLPYVASDLNKPLDDMKSYVYTTKRLHEAELAAKARKYDDAIAILEDMKNDKKIPRQGKANARRMLSKIKKIKERLKKKE